MTLFEYLAIAFSLVLSFSAMRLVGGLPHAIRSDRRYWVHLAFVVGLLFNVTNSFWVFWSFRDIDWNYPRFLLALANPCFLYLLAATIIPENPETVGSWRDHYYAIRQRYFVGWACWVGVISVSSSVLLGVALLHPLRAGHLGMFVASVLGATSRSPRIHAGLAVVILGAGFILVFSVFAQPAPLAN